MAKPAKDATELIQSNWPGASVAERGRGYIKLAHPSQADRFALVSQSGGAGWHFGDGPYTETNEVDTAWVDAVSPQDDPWQRKMILADYHAYFGNGNLDFDSGMPFRYEHPDTGDYIQWQPGANIQWTNDLNQLENIGIAKQGITAAITDDQLYFSGAYGTGLDYEIELQSARLRKNLIIDSLVTIGSPPQFILDGGNPVLMLTLLFQRSSGVQIWVDGVQWAEGNGQGAAVATTDDVEFRASDGTTVLWRLDPAFARDLSTNGNVSTPVITRLRRLGGTYFIELRVPWSWLETAVYPVTVDPTVNPAVGASTDDVNEDFGGTVYDSDNRRLNSSFPYAGFRIPLAVSNGSTTNDSYLSIYGDHPSLTDLDSDWDMVAEDNCAAWSTGAGTFDVSGRTLTGNAVDCSVTLSTSAYVDSATSATTALDALFARGGWSSGNYGGIVLTYKGAVGNAQYSSYNDDSAKALMIYIDYTESGGGGRTTKNTDASPLGIGTAISWRLNS